jgi:translocation and assembly module TamB
VIAGVRVTGSADEPKAEIFSDPAMSQQEALSYLLRGQGLTADKASVR